MSLMFQHASATPLAPCPECGVPAVPGHLCTVWDVWCAREAARKATYQPAINPSRTDSSPTRPPRVDCPHCEGRGGEDVYDDHGGRYNWHWCSHCDAADSHGRPKREARARAARAEALRTALVAAACAMVDGRTACLRALHAAPDSFGATLSVMRATELALVEAVQAWREVTP